MMKKLLAASALAVLAVSPALAIDTNASAGAPTGTGAARVTIDDASGGYTPSGQYVRPHDRVGANDPFWRTNPVTGSVALAFAPVAGAFGYDSGYGAYASAPDTTLLGVAPVIADGKYLGADPDPNVRMELRRSSVQFQ